MPSSNNQKVRFFFDGIKPNLKNRKKLRKFLIYIFKNEGRSIKSINYIFTTDKKILEINKQYLKHNFFTDIITFELSPKQAPVEADIYISIDRIHDNIKDLGVIFQSELHRVIFHGALHLSGFSDKTLSQKKRMRAREDFYLSKFKI